MERDGDLARSLERVLERAGRDPELAAALRDLAERVLERLGPTPGESATPAEPSPAPSAGTTAHAVGAAVDPSGPGLEPPAPASPEDISRLIASFGASVPRGEAEPFELPEFEVEEIAGKLRLKARAARWVAAHGYTNDYAALGERIRLLEAARGRNCELWMLDLRIVNPYSSDGAPFELLARSYETTLSALALWSRLEGEREESEAARLLAEAQSALRVAAGRARQRPASAPGVLDAEQSSIFEELRAYGDATRTYLDHLSLDRLAEPEGHESLAARLELLENKVEARKRAQRTRRETLRLLRYHADKLTVKNHAPEHDRAKVREVVGVLLAQGLPESDLAFDAPLRPILEQLEPGAEPRLARVLSYVRERSPQAERQRGEAEPEPEAQRVRYLLAGRSLVLLGGIPKPEAGEKLERAFGCPVNWLESRAHQSHYDFESAIVRPEVALVVLLIRWSSHAFAEVSAFCRDHGKPLVRAPGGYGVNSLARAILEQASEQL